MITLLNITTPERIHIAITKDEQDAKYPIILDIEDASGNRVAEWLSTNTAIMIRDALAEAVETK